MKTIKKRPNEHHRARRGSAGGTPIVLRYEPLESTKNMKRLLRDLTKWILEKRIHHRQASACRALLHEYLAVEEFERLPQLEARIKVLEESRDTN